MAFSPDSKYLAAGTGWPFWHAPRKSNLYVWDVESLQEVNHSGASLNHANTPLHENDSIIMAVEFTPDGKALFAADHKGFVRIWDTATWSLETTLRFPQQSLTTSTFLEVPEHDAWVGIFRSTEAECEQASVVRDIHGREPGKSQCSLQ